MRLAECHQAGAGEPCRIPMKPSRPGRNGKGRLCDCVVFSGGSQEGVVDPGKFQGGWPAWQGNTDNPGVSPASDCLYPLLYLLLALCSTRPSLPWGHLRQPGNSSLKGGGLLSVELSRCAEAARGRASEPRGLCGCRTSQEGPTHSPGQSQGSAVHLTPSNPECQPEAPLRSPPKLFLTLSPLMPGFISSLRPRVVSMPQCTHMGCPAQPHSQYTAGTQGLLNE